MQVNNDSISLANPVLVVPRREAAVPKAGPPPTWDLIIACRRLVQSEVLETAVWILMAASSVAALLVSLWV